MSISNFYVEELSTGEIKQLAGYSATAIVINSPIKTAALAYFFYNTKFNCH